MGHLLAEIVGKLLQCSYVGLHVHKRSATNFLLCPSLSRIFFSPQFSNHTNCSLTDLSFEGKYLNPLVSERVYKGELLVSNDHNCIMST